jgi:hypothetical protein
MCARASGTTLGSKRKAFLCSLGVSEDGRREEKNSEGRKLTAGLLNEVQSHEAYESMSSHAAAASARLILLSPPKSALSDGCCLQWSNSSGCRPSVLRWLLSVGSAVTMRDAMNRNMSNRSSGTHCLAGGKCCHSYGTSSPSVAPPWWISPATDSGSVGSRDCGDVDDGRRSVRSAASAPPSV